MKEVICVSLAFAVLLGGCAGREANLVQVRQLGDEQKTCDGLRTELYYIENEISRLLPKSDKTGRNIALGATGILFIVPLFFMDLKQGEKKEIEAYRQRYNHLLMITQQKDCKLPTAVAEETVERIPSAEEAREMAKEAKKTKSTKDAVVKNEQMNETPVKEITSAEEIINSSKLIVRCANCGEKIGNLEESYGFGQNTVCKPCHTKLNV